MRKRNGSNNVPGWVKRDIQVLKRVSVSLVDLQRQARRDMAETRRDMAETRQDMAETRRDMVEMRHENQKMFAEMARRNDRLEEQTASLKEETASLKLETAASIRTMEARTASLKKVSDIHTKAIMRILDKI